MAGSTAERWLSVSEAGRALGLSRTSLLAAEEAGLLASVRTPGGHRRYRPAELRRYLRAAGASTAWPDEVGGGHPGSGADPFTRRVDALDAAAALRVAARPVAKALGAECAGVYLQDAGGFRFSAAFGVPRWLAERLAVAAPPQALVRASAAASPQLFDPTAEAFPEPRSTGRGIAAALRHDEQAVGVLFVVLPAVAAPLSGELRTVEAFAELVTQVVLDRSRISALEHRLAAIAALTKL
jgi:hypothetical protein